jgi:hypothetical protein
MTNFTEIDFDTYTYKSIVNVHVKPKKDNNKAYHISYEDRTSKYYTTLRIRKMDPFINIELEDVFFKFDHMWDPYTGERTMIDPFGPLCFDPDTLIHYFHINRLKNLWVPSSRDINNNYYEAYYDMLVGSNMNIIGRGECPEKYLFRLPIIDCYLEKDYNKSVITMGPILTNNEIKQIDILANMNPDNYINTFGYNRPSLYEMKTLYDKAVYSDIYIKNKENYTKNELKSLKYKINCDAVDKLKNYF